MQKRNNLRSNLTENINTVMSNNRVYKTLKVESNEIEAKCNLLFAENYEVITICQAEGSKVIILAKRTK